jgi:signal transduction histidine kinase
VLQRTDGAIARALRITHQILDYAQLGTGLADAEAIDVRPTLDRLLRELTPDLDAQAIHTDVSVAGDVRIPMREAHLHSVLQNLISNARDALAERSDATPRNLSIQAHQSDAGVVLSVVDNGAGIAPDIQHRLFEPFFSTKPTHGTGLGLGVVKKLVEMYRGEVRFESERGKGTRFEVQLPVTRGEMR